MKATVTHCINKSLFIQWTSLLACMHYAVFRITLNVEFIPFWYEQKSHMWSLALIHSQSFENARRSLSTCIYKRKPFLRDRDVKVIQFLSTVSTVKNDYEPFIQAKTTFFGNVTVEFTFLKSFPFNQNGFFASCKFQTYLESSECRKHVCWIQ